MKKICILLLLLTTASLFAATWTGASSEYWNHPSNWSPASVPTSATDVVIPGTGITNWPLVSGVSANCRDLTIQSGGRVKINNQPLTVARTFTNNGHLDMQVASAWLVVQGDAIWNSGSTLTTGGFCTFDYYGDLTLESGSSMTMSMGFLKFKGTPRAYFINRSANTQIYHLTNSKTYTSSDPYSGHLVVDNDPVSQPFTIAGNLENGATAKTYFVWTGNVTLKGDLTTVADYDYMITWVSTGTLIMDGYHQSIDLNGDSSVPNLIARQTGNLTLNDHLYVYGNLTIESGVLIPGAHSIWMSSGNWINTAGPDAFDETGSLVVFTSSSGHQYCNNSETFNNLRVNKAAGSLRINNSAAVVTCAQYDWTNGGIDVLAGTFTANDLAEDGVYGEYWVNPNATINLSNPGSTLNMKDVKIVFTNGGTININGVSGDSRWEDIDLTMSGALSRFAFNNIGIYILNSASFTPVFNISGGTISTTGKFQNDRSTFNPTAGTIELNGSASSNLYVTAGSLYALKINKTTLANTVYLIDNLTVRNVLSIDSGTLDLGNQTLLVHQPVNVFGKLKMNSSLAVLDARHNLIFNDYSTGEINAGIIYCGLDATINPEASFGMAPDAHLYITHSLAGTLEVQAENALFGTVHIGTASAAAVCSLSDLYSREIEVTGDLFIYPGSTANLNGALLVSGDFENHGVLNVGSGNFSCMGYFRLELSGTLNIDTGTCLVDQVNVLAGTLSINSGSFINNSFLVIQSTASVQLASGLIQSTGLMAEYPGTLQPAGGLIRLYDDSLGGMGLFEVAPGNWVPNLEFALPQAYTAILQDDLTIKGDFNLVSGMLSSATQTIYISGNWSNQGGVYSTNSGRVVFNGSGHQYVNNSETFNIVEANKSGGAIRVNGTDAVVTFAQYDWTAGAVDVLAGTLNINDLADNGMYGGYYCTPGGTLNIVQDAAQTLNLFGIIQLTGGAVNISGGSGADANWARYSACTVNVSGGSLNYLDKGIQIRNTYAFTNSITGGTISTAGSIYCNRTDFVPAGGTFEMTGATNANLDFQSAPGSSLYNLRISKANLSARVTQTASVQTIRGDLTIDNGTYYMLNRTLNCLGFLRIFTDAMLSCQGLSTVKMGAAKAIYVNSGGYIDAVGTNNDTRTTFTHISDGTYSFNIYEGGHLGANFATFEYLDGNGLHIYLGGLVDGLHNCTFQNGTAGAPLLNVDNEQNFVMNFASFPTNAGGNAYNIRKSAPLGSITLNEYSGVFSGEDFEYDPNDRVYWTGPDVNLQLVQVHWLRPDGYVCAPLQATFMVVNGGTHDIVTPIRIDLYKNLPTAPPAGTLGDLYQEIPALSSGTAVYVTFNDVSTDIAGSWTPWARVDANQIIPETNENDNLLSSLPVTYWEALPEVTGLTMTRIGFAGLRLDWDYPISVNRFNVYRSEDPYFTPVPGSAWANVTTDYINTVFNNEMWFYTVKAERDLP